MQRRWSTSSLSKLVGVHPDLRRVMDRALQEAPFDFRITEGPRTLARQKQLVAIGASKTLRSRHIPSPRDGFARAVDLVPLVDIDNDGKIETEEMYAWPLYHRLAPAIKAAAKAEGVPIEWGGDWKTFKDGPHWQLPWAQYPA
jgi:peptidoglycan L-alanyl-D-glutamate endopeptidase CwlK